MPKTLDQIDRAKGVFTETVRKDLKDIEKLLKENYPLCYTKLELDQLIRMRDRSIPTANKLYGMCRLDKYKVHQPRRGWYQYKEKK